MEHLHLGRRLGVEVAAGEPGHAAPQLGKALAMPLETMLAAPPARSRAASVWATTSACPWAKTPALGRGLPTFSGSVVTSPMAKTWAKRVSQVAGSIGIQP